jgi:hypothetical protein
MAKIRTLVTFESPAFNTTERRDYFINEGCYGDDLARSLIEQFRSRGVQTEAKPGQEDFGWYFGFTSATQTTNLSSVIVQPTVAIRQSGLVGLSARQD